MTAPPFKRLLIANRGEVSVRIARACADLGVATVAVVSDVDVNAHHARVADEVVAIGPAPASESYLRGDRIIAAALERDCQAIHPGYGFLSQNADFAAAVAEAGLVFVGPPPQAMRLMGDKTAARASMVAAGVPVVPGHQGDGDEPLEALVEAAAAVGYPLLVKAAAGGGGKGMRVVGEPGRLADAVQSARHEAVSAFGDGRLFLERFIPQAHHVEIQVMADAHGQVVHMFERECSVQRRYQKIIEESPSPLLDDDLRQEMCRTAVAAARACGYVNAGTIEFLVSPVDRAFYFLEMNTRLQVEHPVTEWVTGTDIVQAQIRIAAGEPLPFTQEHLSMRGHALECRVYAEDPAMGFAPSTGRAHRVLLPGGPGIRVDAGVESGDQVSVYYDPLLAKIVVHAEDRSSAIARMRQGLKRAVVLGVATNLRFLEEVLAHPTFQAGEATTSFIDREMPDAGPEVDGPSYEVLVAVALWDHLASATHGPQDLEPGVDRYSPWRTRDSFRVGGK